MRLRLVTVGKLRDQALRANVEEYLGRLRRRYEVSWTEVRKETGSRPPAELSAREGARILEQSAGTFLVALDEHGRQVTSRQLSDRLRKWVDGGVRDVVFAVGGPYGHSEAVLAAAQWTWSLSPLTFAHPLVPLLVAEQLYRADSILHGEPYHND